MQNKRETLYTHNKMFSELHCFLAFRKLKRLGCQKRCYKRYLPLVFPPVFYFWTTFEFLVWRMSFFASTRTGFGNLFDWESHESLIPKHISMRAIQSGNLHCATIFALQNGKFSRLFGWFIPHTALNFCSCIQLEIGVTRDHKIVWFHTDMAIAQSGYMTELKMIPVVT